MKQTYETLRAWYLKDLQNADIHHGRTSPKARHINHWNSISERVHKPINPEARIWVWSDTHFGHKNIIKYAEGHRPFASVEEMDAAMERRYLEVVKPDDIVIFGGDIAFKNVNDMNRILARLPGYKIQIIGNHDMDRGGWLIDYAFDERHLCMVHDIPGTKYQLLFTHYPLDTVPPNCVNVHGHIHQNLADQHNINVCVEHTGCAPRSMASVYDEAIAYLNSKQP